MRLELAGSILRPPPLAVKLQNGVDFVPQQYIEQGYTDFEVLVIGAGGGTGGGIKTGNTGTQVRSYGGAGGGGGLHRVRGLLSALPAACPVVIGVGGNPGLDHVSDPSLATDGEDGGSSSFNGDTARASGGEGGRRVQTNSVTVSSQANGGAGGVGDRTLSGGGAAGGVAGTPTGTGPGTPGTAGSDGSWDGVVGEGGGGGGGGVGTYLGVTANAATAGGRGSFDLGDTSVYGLGSSPRSDSTDSGATNIVPGGAGGARATPLNHLPVQYGQSYGIRTRGADGYGVIVLTRS